MGSLRECALRGPYYHYYCRRFISIYCIYFYRPCAVSREALQKGSGDIREPSFHYLSIEGTRHSDAGQY